MNLLSQLNRNEYIEILIVKWLLYSFSSIYQNIKRSTNCIDNYWLNLIQTELKYDEMFLKVSIQPRGYYNRTFNKIFSYNIQCYSHDYSEVVHMIKIFGISHVGLY